MEAKTASSTLPQWRCTRFAIATCGLILAIIASLQNDLSTSARFSMGDISFISPTRFDNGSTYNSNDDTKKTIAYAVSVTACPSKKQHSLIDGAAVLHQSIRLASRTSKYDYQMLAFVHPEAIECSSMLQQLGYEVQIRDTPFNESLVKNANLVNAQLNTCCGFKEYLKLYSYVQTDYPVVVHLDLDCLVLKPLDDVFDLMLDPTFDRRRIPAMWLAPEDIPKRVDFVFTRDYGMVEVCIKCDTNVIVALALNQALSYFIIGCILFFFLFSLEYESHIRLEFRGDFWWCALANPILTSILKSFYPVVTLRVDMVGVEKAKRMVATMEQGLFKASRAITMENLQRIERWN